MTVVADIVSVAASGELLIQPPSGEEWSINTVTHEYDCELYMTDGTNYVLLDSHVGSGGWTNLKIQITNTVYLAVRNLDSANARLIGYSGISL